MPEQRNIRIEDDQGNQYFPHTKAKVTFLENGENVEQAINKVNNTLNNLSSTADKITIADASKYYDSSHVEGALQEIGKAVNGSRTSLINSVNNILNM